MRIWKKDAGLNTDRRVGGGRRGGGLRANISEKIWGGQREEGSACISITISRSKRGEKIRTGIGDGWKEPQLTTTTESDHNSGNGPIQDLPSKKVGSPIREKEKRRTGMPEERYEVGKALLSFLVKRSLQER